MAKIVVAKINVSPPLNARTRLKLRIDRDLYDEMMTDQSERCAICRKKPTTRKLAVDHSHITGQIRGLLCGACNAGLGMFKDDLTVLNRAMEYLPTQKDYGEVN